MKKNNNKTICKYLKFILVGVFSGAINGFFGAGGGLALVPLCKFVGNLDTKMSHATTLTCIWLMCICGSIVYFSSNVYDINLIGVCLFGSIFGSLIGTSLMKKLKGVVVDLIFSIAIVCAGIFMIIL